MDEQTYRRYTAPAELHKALNMLRGIMDGIQADSHITDGEAMELANWCSLHANLESYTPFAELLPLIRDAMADGRIDEEEREDILWLCQAGDPERPYYDLVTSELQYLNGFAHGLLADGRLVDEEILALQRWIDDREDLMGSYPFDEIRALLAEILRDGVVTPEERGTLTAFLSSLLDYRDSYNLREADYEELRRQYSVAGVCALCPEISFAGRTFVFTGEACRPRDELMDAASARGGKVRKSVSSRTDYLVVGSGGNPCWAYARYGRKIEAAVALRKQGARLQIIHEDDYWDAVEDTPAPAELDIAGEQED